jgi:FMN reductase
MTNGPLKVLAVVGSLNRSSVTRTVIHLAAERLRADGCSVDVLDLLDEPLALFNPDSFHQVEGFDLLKARVEQADVYLLGTPDYHGSISSALKNFLDHFWREFAGKLFATVVASHEKGLTVIDQLRTVARQCYAWTLPYGVSFVEGTDLKEGPTISEGLEQRLRMLVRDVQVYGRMLTEQRKADLAGNEPGFMARLRS